MAGGRRALHQLPRVGLSAGVEAVAPPPPPAVEKYRGVQVPAPLPRPRAGSGPSRPSGQAPLPSGPGPAAFSRPAMASGCGAPAGSERPGMLGPCPHLWPLGSALQVPRTKAGIGRTPILPGVAAPKELHGRSLFSKPWPGVADKGPRDSVARLPGIQGRAGTLKGQRVGGQIGSQAGLEESDR